MDMNKLTSNHYFNFFNYSWSGNFTTPTYSLKIKFVKNG